MKKKTSHFAIYLTLVLIISSISFFSPQKASIRIKVGPPNATFFTHFNQFLPGVEYLIYVRRREIMNTSKWMINHSTFFSEAYDFISSHPPSSFFEDNGLLVDIKNELSHQEITLFERSFNYRFDRVNNYIELQSLGVNVSMQKKTMYSLLQKIKTHLVGRMSKRSLQKRDLLQIDLTARLESIKVLRKVIPNSECKIPQTIDVSKWTNEDVVDAFRKHERTCPSLIGEIKYLEFMIEKNNRITINPHQMAKHFAKPSEEITYEKKFLFADFFSALTMSILLLTIYKLFKKVK